MSDRPGREQFPLDGLINRGYGAPRPVQTPHAGPPSDQQHVPRPAAANPTASPALHRYPAGNGRTMELPPLPQAPSASGGSFSPASRSVGVASILNPADPDEQSQSRRRKASQLESANASMPILPPLGTSHQGPPSAAGTPSTSAMNLSGSFSGERPRRILTPRSPSLHRAASLNQLSHPPVPTYTAQHASFAVSPRIRSYAIESGSAGPPPLPTPPAAARQGYRFPVNTPSHNASASSRRVSAGPTRGNRPTSESTSPRSSYSSYSQADPASPAASYAPSSMPTLSSAYPSGPEQQSFHERHHQPGVPISSSGGQNVYQMMTLETTSGTVQLPVDVQAASRVADEKRRRNAGASARFRQRRKEKEKEASTTISRLEQQVKELGEDLDFYKRERDYLAGVVLQVPGGDRHFPRPQSPRHRRSPGMVGPSTSSYIPLHEHGARSPDEGRNVRRRTSTLSLPQPTPAPNALPPAGGGYQPSYAPQGYGQPLAPQPPQQVHQAPGPLPSSLSRGPLPTPAPPGPSLMQAAPQTGPWNPYAERRSTSQQHQQHPPPPQPPSQHHRDSR